jgi:hypothetical protein
MMSGTPFGAVKALLSMSSTGWPLDNTLREAVDHEAVTQGSGFEPLTNGQPAMVYGAGMVTMGWPLTSTRGFGAEGCATPPCAHWATAPT